MGKIRKSHFSFKRVGGGVLYGFFSFYTRTPFNMLEHQRIFYALTAFT
ncbi:hypothetical protein BSM4216_1069 [Bacillus smithii]|jgi:hypothetical protein|nr:hypothetical protein BSM4216_1069 [Bacillus smithii]